MVNEHDKFWDRVENKQEQLYKNVSSYLKETYGSTEKHDERPGFGKYTIVELIAKGGSSTVYKAFDYQLNRHIALKVLENASGFNQDRFSQEAQIIATLQHPNIVHVYEVGSVDGKPYIAMQYIEGITFDEYISESTLADKVKVIADVCDALEHAHKHGVIHRDIKPHNVMIDLNNRTFVLDFGIAKQVDSVATVTRELFGTPHYMSPEQIQGGELDARSDIYSVGVLLYKALTAREPFDSSEPVKILMDIIEKDPPPPSKINPHIPVELEDITLKCMFKDPKLRYENASALRSDLARFIEGEPVLARDAPITYSAKRFVKKNKREFLAALSLILLMVTIYAPFYIKSLTKSAQNEVVAARKAATPYYENGMSLMNVFRHADDGELSDKRTSILNSAVEQFTMAIETDKTYAQAYMRRGELYMRSGDYRKAFSDLSGAIEHGSQLSDAYFYRILCSFTLLWQNSADQESDRMVELMRTDLAELMKNGMPSRVMCAQAAVKIADGAYEQSLPDLDIAIAKEPTLMEAYYMRGLSRAMMISSSEQSMDNEFVKTAISDFEKYLSVEVASIDCCKRCAYLYAYIGNHSKALEYISKLREHGAMDPECFMVEAKVYLEMKNYDKVRSILNESAVAERSITDPLRKFRICKTRAYLRVMMNDKGAQKAINRAIYLAPEERKSAVREYFEQLKKQAK